MMKIGGALSNAKLLIIFILVLGFGVTILFGFIPMSKKYPGYGISAETAPAFYSGVSTILSLVFIYFAITKLN